MATTSKAGIKIERNLEYALKPFIIRAALPNILALLERDQVRLAFSNRTSRLLGYYTPPKIASRPKDGKLGFDYLHTISLQIDLNPYALLFVLLHEWAHLITRKEYGDRVHAHGKEWKNNFKKLFAPFFSPRIFPEDILQAIDAYFIKTSRFFETSLDEACSRYGRNRKEFSKTYFQLLRAGTVIPAPYMGSHAEDLLEKLRQKQEAERLRQRQAEFRTLECPKPVPPQIRVTAVEAVSDIPIHAFIRMENRIYRILGKEQMFALVQDIESGQLSRIHFFVKTEVLDPESIRT